MASAAGTDPDDLRTGEWVLGALNFVAARGLQRRTFYHCILVAAALDALVAMPLGTVLGVFTFLVLLRESAKALFPPPASEPRG